jgi:hypothetical protein
MKTFFSTIFIFVNCLCFAGSVAEPIATGEWSEPANGLRGRLLIAEFANKYDVQHDVRERKVYLELQNISPGDTLYVYYNFGRSSPQCELRDSTDKIIKNTPDTGSDWLPPRVGCLYQTIQLCVSAQVVVILHLIIHVCLSFPNFLEENGKYR